MSERKSKVFVVNRSAHDYSPAEKHGELVFVTKGYQNKYAANHHVRVWMEALKDSGPEDYILLSSTNVICSIGAALFAMMHGRLNLLMFRSGKYIKRELVLHDVLAAEDIEIGWAFDYIGEQVSTDPVV